MGRYYRPVLKICQQCARLSTSTSRLGGTKKDLYYEEKLPIYEYNQINREKNRLYVFGTASTGAIGLDSLIKPKDPEQKVHLFMWQPVRHKFGEFHSITDMAAGHGFSLIAIKPRVENGPYVFGCGLNSASQLGYQAARAEGPLEVLLSLVPLPFSGKNSRVLALGAGRAHSLISVDGEGLFTLGDNNSGQCGRTVVPDEAYFGSKYIQKFSRFKDDGVVNIASRFDLSVCVTQSGRVFTAGANNKGQLGRGKDAKFWEFQELGGDVAGVKIKKTVTSGASVLALSEEGELFGWGCNEWGQIDPENPGKIYYHPRHINLPSGIQKLTDVAIGDLFSFVLNQQGNLYVWGQGPCLGLGPSTPLVKTPTQLPPPLFGSNKFTPDVQVVSITSSFNYAAAINSVGDLYTWGRDNNGCLGLKRTKHQPFPLRVCLNASAKRVCLGVDHSVVIAKAG